MQTTAYQLGRLLAALEHLKATKQSRQLYVQASSSPAAMQAAIARASATEAGAELLTPIMAALPVDAFARPLTEEEASEFGLGYYHQRAAFRAGRLPVLPDNEPELEVRYELRIDPDLKAWVKANGGDRLVRALLREARAHSKKE